MGAKIYNANNSCLALLRASHDDDKDNDEHDDEPLHLGGKHLTGKLGNLLHQLSALLRASHQSVIAQGR